MSAPSAPAAPLPGEESARCFWASVLSAPPAPAAALPGDVPVMFAWRADQAEEARLAAEKVAEAEAAAAANVPAAPEIVPASLVFSSSWTPFAAADDAAAPAAAAAVAAASVAAVAESPLVDAKSEQMLKLQPKYFTRIRHVESMKLPSQAKITREDASVPDARVFLLHGLLSSSECAHYIRETESMAYRDLAGEFAPDYRSNQRILVLSPQLSDMLWARMEPHLTRADVVRVRPMCFGNGGTWRPFRLNECMKFGRYQTREHFSTHIDGPWVPREDESSIYTVLIYLNDDFTGGRTVFLPQDQRARVEADIASQRRGRVSALEAADALLVPPTSGSGFFGRPAVRVGPAFHRSAEGLTTVYPTQGSALVFTHDTLHAGLPVASGAKYVLRTEIMFRRVDTALLSLAERKGYEQDPDYAETIKLYTDSYEKSKEGDVAGFTDSYLKALALQAAAQRSVGADTLAIHRLPLPVALYVHCFTFLSLKDLATAAFRVNRAFKDVAMDGSLWKLLYRAHYPTVAPVIERLKASAAASPAAAASGVASASSAPAAPASSQLSWVPLDHVSPRPGVVEPNLGFGQVDPAIQDWRSIFLARHNLSRLNYGEKGAVVFDFGSCITKAATLDLPVGTVVETQSVSAAIEGVSDLHARVGAHQRHYVGAPARAAPQWMYGFERGRLAQGNFVTEAAAALYLRLTAMSERLPVLVAQPPGQLWDKDTRTVLAKNFLVTFRAPAVCFASSAVLALLSVGRLSGLVANVTPESMWACAVVQGKEVAFVEMDPSHGGLVAGAGASPNAKHNARPLRPAQPDEVELVPVNTLVAPRLARAVGRLVSQVLASSASGAGVDAAAGRGRGGKGGGRPLDQQLVESLSSVLLIGGPTSTQQFRDQFRAELAALKPEERMAHLKQEGGVAEDSLPPLELILPAHATRCVVEGGKVFAALPLFRQRCIDALDYASDAEGEAKYLQTHSAYSGQLGYLAYAVNDMGWWSRGQGLWREAGDLFDSLREHFHVEADRLVSNFELDADNLDLAFAHQFVTFKRRVGKQKHKAQSRHAIPRRSAYLSLGAEAAAWFNRQSFLRDLTTPDKQPPRLHLGTQSIALRSWAATQRTQRAWAVGMARPYKEAWLLSEEEANADSGSSSLYQVKRDLTAVQPYWLDQHLGQNQKRADKLAQLQLDRKRERARRATAAGSASKASQVNVMRTLLEASAAAALLLEEDDEPHGEPETFIDEGAAPPPPVFAKWG